MRDLFLLDPEIIFLNHGSFGATPRPVFAAYQAWQLRLERQPVLFLGREFPALEREARGILGAYLGACPEDLALIPNDTYGVNLVARSLALQPGDEILASDHEYGACDYTWDFICRKTGARYLRQPVPLPASPEEMLAALWQGVTPRTRLIFLSHITSPTSVCFPVEAVCRRARAEGLLTLIDGAHAPGQAPVNLNEIGADFYTGNCHKWMLSPKGAAFLYTRPERQTLIEPLVVSWGYGADETTTAGSRYQDLLQWDGTHDPAASLSVPAAIEFLQSHGWEEVGRECHRRLSRTLEQVEALTGLPSLYRSQAQYYQMASFELPPVDLPQLKTRLYEDHHIEIPTIEWQGRQFLRLSVQGYNSQEDLDALVVALERLLPRVRLEG
jgi:isopenicillin-N epimerase